MAKVKIILEKGETPEQAEEMLLKALNSQRQGEAHTSEDSYPDPAMQSSVAKMQDFYNNQLNKMMQEINEVIDSEFV